MVKLRYRKHCVHLLTLQLIIIYAICVKLVSTQNDNVPNGDHEIMDDMVLLKDNLYNEADMETELLNESILSDNRIDDVIDTDPILDSNGLTELTGGNIIGERILRLSESPYLLRTDLEVDKGGILTVEPGVTIYFAPQVGITVRGSIKAVGTAEQKIIFTSLNTTKAESLSAHEFGARLVDGPTPLEGRLQLFHQGKWRSVCTNSRNWTMQDYETACRMMGFQGGRFWNWVDRMPNFEPRLLYEEPRCRGVESNLYECFWETRAIGSGVCDYHSDLGIQCKPLLDVATAHWRGLVFINAPSQRTLATDNTVYEALSMSSLQHVDIIRAGSGRGRETSAAIEVIGIPPVLKYVSIDHSAYTGINVTRANAAFKFSNVTVQRSRGFGIFVNSSYGLAQLEGCTVIESGSDGIRYIGHDLRADERSDRGSIHDFCTLPTTAGQTYPISVLVQQSQFASITKECGKYFFTRSGYVLTVSFVYFETARNESSEIQVFDGSSSNDRLLGSWEIRNSTRPQSITSTREKVYIKFRAEPRLSVLGFLRITTGPFKTYDLNVTSSNIADNGGRGIAIDNLRSQLHIHSSSISNNGHVAGVHVINGAGDVNITDSRISFNQGDGVNITYTGGNRNISRTSISSNQGHGIAIWLNQTFDKDRDEFYAFNQTTTLEYSDVIKNLETGLIHGNFCGDSYINITGNYFNHSLLDSVDIRSCWRDYFEVKKLLRLQIGHNIFEHNNRIGVLISPALFIDGRIEYNHFRHGRYGSLHIRNEPLEEFRALPANFLIQHNQMYLNKGFYVAALGLSPYGNRDAQSILFTRNFVRDNKIREPFGPNEGEGEGMSGERRLNPRSRVAAPIVISSSNVDVFRNIISNHDSRYEVGSQLPDQSQVLNVTYNWLGYSEEERIYDRLFHRKDRYDLAKIEYLPYLLHNSNPGTNTILQNPIYVPRFFSEGSERVGGEVDGLEILPTGTYTVNRDINIRPGGKLILNPGVTLNFAASVGMMVAGKLEARGKQPNDIMFTLKREPVMINNNNDSISESLHSDVELMNIEMGTEMYSGLEETPNVLTGVNPGGTPENDLPIPIRLLGGRTEHEGRLQVLIDGEWGTVCDYGWTIINAALACHQLGLALNPTDWQFLHSEVPDAGTGERVLLSNVRCTEHDIDLTQCRAERATRGEFLNSCSHENDVGLRCYEGAWAGLRLGVLAERTDLQYLTIERAGLFDYATNTLKPAVQIDFARHNFDHVRVVDNLYDGVGIVYSDIFGGNSINNIRNSEFSGNRGSGIALRQLGLKVFGSVIRDNLVSGIKHDSVMSAIEQRELAGSFHMAPDFNIADSDYRPYIIPKDDGNINLETWQTRHILTQRMISEENIEKTINIKCQPGYVIGLQLLNPIENRSSEEIWIYDSQTGNSRSEVWQLSRDISVFPATSSSYGIVIHYKSGLNALGGVVIVLSTLPAPVQDIRNRIVRGPVPTLLLTQTKIQNNGRGISGTYYNRYLGELGEHYLRKANESIKIVGCEISHNLDEAVFINAPFWDVHTSNLSEVTIHINNSLIMDNGRGIRHLSKDLRSSNNIFHYVLQDTTIERNSLGGLELSLPYVWQYNENFTHSIYLGNDTWTKNRKFGIVIDGHYAVVNITQNRFSDNECKTGLVAFRGMEKRMKIDNNKFTGNNGRFIMEFRADSLSEIIGEVNAIFTLNEIRENRYETARSGTRGMTRSDMVAMDVTQQPTCVIGFGGIQKVKIFRNLIANNKQSYDLVAGIRSARLNNYLEATENWWGYADHEHIIQRIFDFDDWNNHAEVLYRPYLLEDTFDASISVGFNEKHVVDIDKLGGRIFEDISIWRRDTPYIIRQDITVMPGATMVIDAGVEMEFAPNIGILVLGSLVARGARDGEIKLRSIPSSAIEANKIEKRSIENMAIHDSIRLCTGRNCSYDENEIDRVHEGFLEYYNHTTLQWVPICDRRFTERNAQVVCRELGFNPLDTYYSHDKRIEFHTNSLTRIYSWVEPLECYGNEMRLGDCPERLNGQLYGRRHECKWDSEFVFVSCNGDLDYQHDYWGGIRFAYSDFEQNLYEYRIHDSRTHSTVKKTESLLEHVQIERAGMLHGEKSPAIQTIIKNPAINVVSIKNCAHDGINLISPSDAINLQFITVDNVLGQGINAISLTGEGRESDESSFAPLKNLDLPYHLFSLLDICDSTKEIVIEERILLYYKYDNNPISCVKIFHSAYHVKPLGFRLLQSNLFNHSKEYGRRDAIHLFDGDIYNVSAIDIGTVEADSESEKRLFRTKGPTLSIRLIASGASARHGFIAEIVTLPVSAIGFNRDAQHNFTNSEITGAVNGAINYISVGEVSPILTLEHNRIMNNCRQLYGNFSTCEAAVNIDVQNMHSLYFRNNLVQSNQGGLAVRADSRGSATSLRSHINHNLFRKNLNRPSLSMEGRQSSPYQEVIIYKNYFTQNNAGFRDVITLRQVVSNFSMNYVHSNRGGRIIEVSGFDKVRLPIYQTTSHNGFYDNIATDWQGRATIVAGTAGQHYVDNIFANPDNDYEMITVNRSLFEFQYWNSTIDVWKTKIDAAHNFWGHNETITVGSRIRDRSDDPLLLEVQYLPLHMNNITILDGKCPPGWTLLQDTCYMYVGAPMSFHEARDFCRSDNASMPFVRGDKTELWTYLQSQMSHLRWTDKVWVQDLNYIDQCTSLIYQNIEIDACDTRSAFLCEIDPKVIIDPLSWQADIVAIGVISAFVLALFFLILLGICWYSKSRHRHAQRLQRRNSIRQSLRSLNSIDPQGSMRRRNLNMSRSTDTLTKSTVTDYKKMMSNGSIDSMDKSVLSSETSYDLYDTKNQTLSEYTNPHQQRNDQVQPSTHQHTSYNEVLNSKFGGYANPRENVPPKTKVYGIPEYSQPGFELAYRNEGFRDNSTYSGTRNNSALTNINDEIPIIHHTDPIIDDNGSDYYGNSSTLPLRDKGGNLSFLNELKQRLPEYEPLPNQSPGHSSFLPSYKSQSKPLEISNSSSTLPFDQKIDKMNFTSPMDKLETRKPEGYEEQPIRRPDSYYTAVRSTLPIEPRQVINNRPRTLYEASGEDLPSPPPVHRQTKAYSRSKSEALLETNFDFDTGRDGDNDSTNAMPQPLKADNRSYSQPLETAM